MLAMNSSVSRDLPRKPASPDAIEGWKAFFRNHREVIGGMDFLTVPTATFGVLYVFFIIDHSRRRIRQVNVTAYPSAAWMIQQLREAFPFEETLRYRELVGSIIVMSGVTIALLPDSEFHDSRTISVTDQGRGLWLGGETCARRFVRRFSGVGCRGESFDRVQTWTRSSSLRSPFWSWRGTGSPIPIWVAPRNADPNLGPGS